MTALSGAPPLFKESGRGIDTCPLRAAPSSIISEGASMLPCIRAVLWSTTLVPATTSPDTEPLMSTVLERMFAWISPVSPMIRVFSLVISPVK